MRFHLPVLASLTLVLAVAEVHSQAPSLGLRVPDGFEGQPSPISVYVRPHDLDLTYERNGGSAWPGRVVRMIPLGGLVRLDVELDDGTGVRVELSRARFAELELQIGDSLYVTPRDIKVFLDQPQPA